MATLALAAIGPALLSGATGGASGVVLAGTVFTIGQVGTFIGGIAGAIVDSTLLFPAIYGGPQDIVGPRIGDLKLQTATEGSPMMRAFGPKNRIAGTVLWKGPLQETAISQSAGKGGGGPVSTTFKYSVSIAIGLGRGEISAVNKIFADGKLIYDATAGTLTAGPSDKFAVSDAGDGTPNVSSLYTLGGPDLLDLGFKSGVDATFSGFSNAGNNGTFPVIVADNDALFSTLNVVNASGVNEAVGASVTVTQTPPALDETLAESVEFYLGSDSQTADPTIDSFEDDVHGFRHRAYVVITNLELGPFGNRLPQFTFEVEEAATRYLSDVIASLLQDAGFTSSDYDVSDLTAIEVTGYALAGPQATAKALDPLILFYDLQVQEVNGVLTFFRRTQSQVYTVLAADLAAHVLGERPPRVLSITDVADDRLPAEVNINYIDPDQDLQQGSQRERSRTGTSDIVQTLEVPIVMTASEAREFAQKRLWRSRAERSILEFTLPPSYVDVSEGDLLRVTQNSETYDVRVIDVTRGANFIMQVRARIEASQTATAAGGAEGSAAPDQVVNTSPVVTLRIIDVAALLEGQVEQAGFYWAVAASDSTTNWVGSQLFQSSDDVSYSSVADGPLETTMGVMNTGFVLGDGDPAVWDRKSTMRVTLNHGTFTSKSESEVLNGANTLLVGSEIVRFTTAVLISGTTWELSNFIRGVNNTEEHTGTHAAGETVVLLDSATVNFQQINSTDIGGSRYYKGVPLGGLVADAIAQQHTFLGETLKPYSPARLKGVRDSSNDIEFTWTRRTRSVFKLFSSMEAPHNDTVERYKIRYYDSPGGTLLRELQTTVVLGVNGADDTYTAAEQTADGITPGDPVTIEVTQVTSDQMEGRIAQLTVN